MANNGLSVILCSYGRLEADLPQVMQIVFPPLPSPKPVTSAFTWGHSCMTKNVTAQALALEGLYLNALFTPSMGLGQQSLSHS